MREFIVGVKNLIKWFPVIWKNRDWDHIFEVLIEEHKEIATTKEDYCVFHRFVQASTWIPAYSQVFIKVLGKFGVFFELKNADVVTRVGCFKNERHLDGYGLEISEQQVQGLPSNYVYEFTRITEG